MNAHTKIAATATLAQLKPGQDYPDGNINARLHYTDAEIDELAASLKGADGQLRPFLVATHPKKSGVFFVFGGGRRRLAYERLIGRGELPKDHPIEIRDFGNISVSEALSKSLADNQAVPMHPADQAATFATLAADRSPEDIAKERGMTVRAVQQSIALGTALAPEVISAWREGKLTREQVEAFTIASDIESQIKALTDGLANEYCLRPKEIRRALARNKEPEMKRLLGFVGIEAARAAGCEVTEDFFGLGGVVKDMKPLKKAAKDKMAGIVVELEAAGWAWVETRMDESFMHHGYGEQRVTAEYTAEEKKRLGEIKAELKAIEDDESGRPYDYAVEETLEEEQHAIENAAEFRAFTAKQKAKGGVLVQISKTGQVVYKGGLVKKDEPKSNSATSTAGKPSAQRAPAPPKIPDINSEQERTLDELKDRALAKLIEAKPKDAFAMFLAGIVHHGWNDPVDTNNLSDNTDGITTGRSFVADMESLRKLPLEKLAAKLAVLVGRITNVHGYMSGNKDAQAIVDMVGEKNLQAELAKGFDAKSYVRDATKQHLLGILAETRGEAERKAHESDGEAKLALPVIEGIKATGWLPPALRTRVYAGPSAKKPAKAKKKGG